MTSRLINVGRAVHAKLKASWNADIKKLAGKRGQVKVVQPDGNAVVDDGSGGCLIVVAAGNVKVNDIISLDNLLQIGEQATGAAVSQDVPPSGAPCPTGELCDLSIGGAAPDAPTGLELTAVSTTELDLAWDPDPCAAEWKVFQATGTCDSNSGFLLVATVTDPSYAATGLTPGTDYAFIVSAVGANESESDMSDCVSAATGGTPTLFATFGSAWDLTTGALSAAPHPPALSDAYGYKTVAGVPNTFKVGPAPGYATATIGDDGGGAGRQGYGSSNAPAGTAGGRYQLGKGPSTGIVAGLEFVMPLVLETPNTVAGRYKIVLALRDAGTFALLATDDLVDVITFMQANDGPGQAWDQGNPGHAHLADFVPKAGVVPDPDGSFWIVTNSGTLLVATRIFKRSPVDGSAIAHVDLAAGNLSFGTDPAQIALA